METIEMTEPIFRTSKKKDLPEVAKILQKEYSKPPYNDQWSIEAAMEKLKEYIRFDGKIFVIEVNKKIAEFAIGHLYIYYDGIHAYLDEIAIDERHQGKGFGKKLIAVFEDYCKINNAVQINLMASKKANAFNIYKKLNYKEDEDFLQLFKRLK